MENGERFPIGCGLSMPGRPPIDIEILLWIYCRASEWEGNTCYFREVADRFVTLGVAFPCGEKPHGYRLTDLGFAWVSAICQTPIPRVAFLGTDGKEIEVWP